MVLQWVARNDDDCAILRCQVGSLSGPLLQVWRMPGESGKGNSKEKRYIREKMRASKGYSLAMLGSRIHYLHK